MLHTLLCVLYFVVLLGLSAFGLHRLHLVVLCFRHRKELAKAMVAPTFAEQDLPTVTIQLPLFNESTVAARLLDSVAKMDYPADKLEIQVLDDSTDETQSLVRAHVQRLRDQGVDAVYLHRVDRVGYKAGALDAGLKVAKGTVQVARKLMKTVLKAPLTTGQRVEAWFHMTPHFAYPLLVLLSVLLLPALVLMPATNAVTMLLVDLPLCVATTGSLAAFYMLAESAQGRPRAGALRRLPALIALGTGLAPHLSKAVFEGLEHMAGEFIRTPKQGVNKGRYRARADVPFTETILSLISLGSVIASIRTGHWFATPFALLFTFGYGYVAMLIVNEQAARRREAKTMLVTTPSERPSAPDADAADPVAVSDLAA